MAEIDDIKEQVAVANRVLAELGLATGVTASLGHASMRVPSEPDKFVVKGRGYETDALATMRPEEMVVCDLEGYKIGGPDGVYQCHEVKIHSCILKTRPQVQSVVHIHPRFTILMSVLKKTLLPMCQEGIALVQHPLPVYPQTKIITTDEEGMQVANMLGDGKAMLLYGHGAITTGTALADSVQSMLQLEEQARMNYYAYCAVGPEYPSIPAELVEETINMMGGVHDLPHFHNLPPDWRPRRSAVFDYYAQLVSRDL